jgi:hypothetical protein
MLLGVRLYLCVQCAARNANRQRAGRADRGEMQTCKPVVKVVAWGRIGV